VLKAPSHLGHLPQLFATYPDARVVVTHRDPLRVIGSLASLMATLQRMRSDQVDYRGMVEGIAFGFAYLVQKVMKQRDVGAVPNDRIIDVRYADLLRDPVGTVRNLYERWQLPFDRRLEERIRHRLVAQQHGQKGGHRYSFAETGLDLAAQRAKFAAYLERYGIPAEE
jgi:hypothetical protein